MFKGLFKCASKKKRYGKISVNDREEAKEESSKDAMEKSLADAMDISGANGVTSQGDNMEIKRPDNEMGVEANRLDIYILCDTTYAMEGYLSSLADTINQTVLMFRLLLPGKVRFAVVSYKDYINDDEVCTSVPLGSPPKNIVAFVKALRPSGGGYFPEATKTGLNKIAEMIHVNENSSSKSIVIHYGNSQPHWEESTESTGICNNKKLEQRALKAKTPGYDWVNICRFFRNKGIPVYTFLDDAVQNHQSFVDSSGRWRRNSHTTTKSLMLHLGQVVLMDDTSPYMVTKATIGILMHVLNLEFHYNADFITLGCDVSSNVNLAGFRRENSGDNQDQGQDPAVNREDINNCMPYLDLTLNLDVKDETLQGNFFPKEAGLHLTDAPFNFPPIGIKLDMNKILKQFSTDEEFQNVVFQVFEELFTPDSCLSITYIPIFGTLWRQVCRLRGNERSKKLRTKLSNVITKLFDPAKKKQMRDWLQAESEYTIADFLFNGNNYEKGQNGSGPYLIIDPAKVKALLEDPTMKEGLRSLARAPTQEGLVTAEKLITSLISIDDDSFEELSTGVSRLKLVRVNSRNGDVIPNYLPLSLRPEILFGCLPHLVSPGMMFTTRPAIMMAIVAFLSGNQNLKEKAETFLLAKKGDWLNLGDVKNFPEILSEETVKLLHRVPQFLTDEENKVYNTLFQVHRLRLAFNKQLSVELPLTPNLISKFCDYRFQCVSCEHYRSFTLMTPGDRCGLCVVMADNHDALESASSHLSHVFCLASSDMLEEDDNDNASVPRFNAPQSDVTNPTSQSRLAYCQSKNCGCIYEVVRHQDLKGKPKCHYCRTKQKVPYVTCKECSNRYVLPDPSLLEKMEQNKDNWTCAICKNTSHLSFEFISFLLKDILSSNLHLMTDIFNLEEASFNQISKRQSLFKIYRDSWGTMKKREPKAEAEAGKDNKAVMLKGQKAVHEDELKAEIRKVVTDEDLTEPCSLCYEDTFISQLATCGNENICKTRICSDCQCKWVNEIQPGKVVFTSHLVCPFCKRAPKESVFTKYNRPAKSLLHKEHLKRVIRRMHEKPDLYYGWCEGCSMIKEIGRVDCGDTVNVPYSTSDTDSFVCETCTVAEQLSAPNEKKCPGCKAPTIKSYGCNHIRCSQCETHWCYVCGDKFDHSTIYDHLRQVHGGIGLEERMDEDEDEDEDAFWPFWPREMYAMYFEVEAAEAEAATLIFST